MRILIIGATGFIGKELVKELSATGHQPLGVSRYAIKAGGILGDLCEIVEWDGKSAESLVMKMDRIDGIVNLAGENIASGRWTEKRKKILTESRVKISKLVSEAIRLADIKPSVLIQGSATGIYGTPVNSPADENHPVGNGFLADLTRQWEMAMTPAGEDFPKVVVIRTGLVLGKNAGLLKKMLLPFKYHSGIIIGSGKQWLSWIHISDQVRAIRFLLENKNSSGPYNLTAPHPVQMKTFVQTLSKVLGKPVWLKIPGAFLKLSLGKMAEETVLSSQNIIPAKLTIEGFSFSHSDLDTALIDLLT